MREIDFLPPWYTQFLGRRRMVFFQTWVTVGIALGLGLWSALIQPSRKPSAVGRISGNWNCSPNAD